MRVSSQFLEQIKLRTLGNKKMKRKTQNSVETQASV